MKNSNCRVCGLYIEVAPWGEGGETPTYEICPCCGVEFGNEDYQKISVLEYRNVWIRKGAIWFSPKQKPLNWNLNVQLKDVPEDFK